MKNLSIILLVSTILFAGCKKDKKNPPVTPETTAMAVSNITFTNKLPVRVVIDIYDSNDYVNRFDVQHPKIRLMANPYATISLPKDSFVQNQKYFYDWYTDSMDITSQHIYGDSLLMKNLFANHTPDSFYYYLPFKYDSTAAAFQVSMDGKSRKYRRILKQSVLTGTSPLWYSVDAYDKITGLSVWSSLSSAQKQTEGLYLHEGFTGGRKGGGWIFYTLTDTSYCMIKIYDNIINKELYGLLTDKVPSIGLSSDSYDTLFMSPVNSPYVYKMCLK